VSNLDVVIVLFLKPLVDYDPEFGMGEEMLKDLWTNNNNFQY